jgi:hypothetical protein
MKQKFPYASGNTNALIRSPLKIDAGLHSSEDISQVGGKGMKPQYDFDALVIDADLQTVDFCIVGNHGIASIFVTLEETDFCIFEAA